MDFETTLMWLVGATLLYHVFKAGQKYEQEEAPRRAAEAENLRQQDGALNHLSLAAVAVGPDSTDFQSAIYFVDTLCPGTSEKWKLLSEEEVQERAQIAAERMKTPEYQYYQERGRTMSNKLRESIDPASPLGKN